MEQRRNLKEALKNGIKPFYNKGKQLQYGVNGWCRDRGVFLDENGKQLLSYRNLHKGERCFLIGTGPSLTPEDLDLIAGEQAFGCNMLYKLYDKTKWRPSYYCMTDRVYAACQSEEMLSYVEVPVFAPKSAWKRMPQKDGVIYVNDIYDYGTYKVRGVMQSYCWLKASVMLFMLELAVYMGFEELYLLGVDCTNTYTKDGHFTRDYMKSETRAAEKSRLERDLQQGRLTSKEMWAHNYRRNIEAYEEMKAFADKRGIRIYNATRGGDLFVFPRVNLEEVIDLCYNKI